MFGLGTPELIIILVILLLLFGGAKLPQLSRSIGQSLQELRRGVEGDLAEPEPPTPPQKTARAPKKPHPAPPKL